MTRNKDIQGIIRNNERYTIQEAAATTMKNGVHFFEMTTTWQLE